MIIEDEDLKLIYDVFKKGSDNFLKAAGLQIGQQPKNEDITKEVNDLNKTKGITHNEETERI